MQTPKALILNGKRVESGSGGTISLVEPATGKPWCEVPAGGTAEIDAALEAASKAFRTCGWSKPSPMERINTLNKLARLIRENIDELAMLEARNAGKPLGDAKWEINAGARCFEYYAGAVARLTGETIPVSGAGLDYTLHVPVGVVAAIVPWNFPFLIGCWKAAPALATGNAVLLKPASLTPLTALRLGELGLEAGIPAGILQVVAGRGGQIGDHLVKHPLVRKITFTGETATGARILQLSSTDIKRVSLELGGKSANVVFADADVEGAAKAAPMSVFANTGQDCCARSRILVEQSAYNRFLEVFADATRKLVVGDPLEEKTEIGPMISSHQRDHVEKYIHLAREEGGKIVCGGDRLDRAGFYLKPTIVEGLPNSARVCQEEIFGPVACVIPFRNEREAVELANETPYGLSGSVWTKDLERGLRVARAIETGVLSVNTNSSVYQEAPFGGFKQSGLGRDLGFEAMKLYTELKNIFIKIGEAP